MSKKQKVKGKEGARAKGSSIGVYRRLSDEEIMEGVEEIKPRLLKWFEENPHRKICKVDWFYGRSIDLRRENYEERIQKELKKLLKKPKK